ncbi:myoD family inhibitor domain-containing protein isoform X2 [Cyclopterus lumpus]|uniref:myoD family inhibitor domain-containing protein isoform X2 n=1 Tax=Cyclopterus lumpus TaxID=8103 RepID=UPI001485D349|nr:myoD family inhibitor domain-containing protein isoform X2 [Cyclopterus lumpus]
MDVNSHADDITESRANQKPVQSECVSIQPTANGTLLHHTEEAPPLRLCDWSDDGASVDNSVTDGSSTNGVARLMPSQKRGSRPIPESDTCDVTCDVTSCLSVVDSSSASPPPPHRSTNQKRLSSTKSHAPMRSDAAHIKEVAGDDWCVHCLLACLFCELTSMCSAVGECLVCGVGGACCCDAAVGCCCCYGEAACTEEACQAALDCGIWEDCCGSSDCLEVCLECCSICFPS